MCKQCLHSTAQGTQLQKQNMILGGATWNHGWCVSGIKELRNLQNPQVEDFLNLFDIDSFCHLIWWLSSSLAVIEFQFAKRWINSTLAKARCDYFCCNWIAASLDFFLNSWNGTLAAKARLHCEELLDDLTKARKDLDSYGQMKVHVLTNVQYDRVEHVSIAWNY